jgi:hypothetical protein
LNGLPPQRNTCLFAHFDCICIFVFWTRTVISAYTRIAELMRWATDPQGASSGPENVLPLADCQLWYAEIHRRADLPVTANQLAEPVIGYALSGRIPARRVPAHHAAPERFTPELLHRFNNGPDVGEVSSSSCIDCHENPLATLPYEVIP